ncbi:MAG: NAD(P)/FAD-dependent oxidoreductase, partial [Acholeplasmataceae bacterium]|nr:NAD(P)/FAD-dependent oxidoreductase [Acholeplasmataceae bacterium]
LEGTLKAELCVEGNKLYENMHEELEIPLLKTGGFVCARNDDEEEKLTLLYIRARENRVFNPHFLSREQAMKLEPNLNPEITKVLSLPSTKVTYPWEVALACIENAMLNGVEFQKNSKVTRITKTKNAFSVEINTQTKIVTKNIINAAGIYADEVSLMIEKTIPYEIKPRKGEYYVLDRRVKGFINHVLYPLPTKKGKGILLIPQVHGNLLIGPNSHHLNDKSDLSSTRSAMDEIRKDASLLAKNIPFDQIIRTFSGMRATSSNEDFYIKESKTHQGFYHVSGIDSPGLTAAPAIAKYVIDIIKKRTDLRKKSDFNPIRKKLDLFHQLSSIEQQKMLDDDPRYGRIICKCEKITEADIINAIKSPVGSDTIKGIKKRARAGSGLCQGGFCESMVLNIIHEQTQKPLSSINYYQQNTPILVKETKVKK